MTNIKPKRALLSVSDKTGIEAFAKGLSDLNIELYSTGGTAKKLRDAGISVIDVSEITQFPEIMDGRVKTLHPKIFGGILARRDAHAEEIKTHNLPLIDLVICNLYPFAKTIAKPNVTFDDAIENIDIGGPSMVRAAAKNFEWVSIVVDPNDYTEILSQAKTGISLKTRKSLCAKAFTHTAQYDSVIANYLDTSPFPQTLNLSFEKKQDCRYGENPHQTASVYSDNTTGIVNAELLQGKPLSYNNLADGDAALLCVASFSTPTCVVVKHANPCGVSSKTNIEDAFFNAFEADSQSAFGGIIALNRPCTGKIAEFLKTVFFEVLIAPDFDKTALSHFAEKKNVRLLKCQTNIKQSRLFKSVSGGLLCQSPDIAAITATDLHCVTNVKPNKDCLEDVLFAWHVIKHVKSNGILTAKNTTTLGIGPGQVSRVDAVKIALDKSGNALEGAVLASDAFFPFRDNIDLIGKSGIQAIIQPGGSVRDQEVINACNEYGIAMLFTGMRCFKH